MKLPKIVLKKHGTRAKKETQPGASERQQSTSTVLSLSDTASPTSQRHLPPSQLSKSSLSPKAAKSNPTSVPISSPKKAQKAHEHDAANATSRRALSRSSSASVMEDSMHSSSAASSQYDDDDDDDDNTSRSNTSSSRGNDDASSCASSRSSASSASSCVSSHRSSSRSISDTRVLSSSAAVAAAESTSKPPRTQYSAYARKMKSAKHQRRALPRANSAVDFDDADEFFDKSDSSLGVGSSPSGTPASDVARVSHRGGHPNDDDDDDDDYSDEEEDEVPHGEVRQPYRSGIPTGRRMTEKELLYRRLAREREEALIAARQAKAQRQASRASPRRSDAPRSAAAPAGAAPSSPRGGKAAAGGATQASSSPTSASRRAPPAPALTATSSTAPVPTDSESRSTTTTTNANNNGGGGSASKDAPAGASEKKTTVLMGWRRKLNLGGHKSSRSSSPPSKEDALSPSHKSSNSTSKMSLSTSSPTAAEARKNGSVQRKASTARVGSAKASPAGSPKASSTSASKAAAAAAAQPSASPTTTTAPPTAATTSAMLSEMNKPISKATLRSLNNKQLSKLDFNAQKARKTTRPGKNSPEDFGPLSAGPEPSLISNGGYGSFMDTLSMDEEEEGAVGHSDTRSTGSRRSNGSRGSRSSRHGRQKHRQQERSGHQQQHDDGASESRPKPPARSTSFFRALFRSNSGVSKNSNGSDTAHRHASAKQREGGVRVRPTTADAVVLAKERTAVERAELARSSESPSSDASGVGTSLYHMESDFSTNASSSGSSNMHTHSSSGHSNSTNGYRGDQILKRRRGNLPGQGKGGVGGLSAAGSMRPHGEGGLNDSFGSLFKAEAPTAGRAPSRPTTTTMAAATMLYGSRNISPVEFGSAPTPGGGPHEVTMAMVERGSVVGGVGAAYSPFQPQPTAAHPGSLFPANSYPRASTAGATAADGKSVRSGAGAPSTMFSPAWHQQHPNALLALDPPTTGGAASTNAATPALTTAPVASPVPTLQLTTPAAATPVPAVGVDAGGSVAGVTAAPSREKSKASAETASTVSPTPVFDEFTPSVTGAAPHRSVSPTTSRDGDGESREGQRRHHRSHRHHNTDASDQKSEKSVGRARRHGVSRKSSLLSVTEGFRVRRRGSGGSSSSNNHRHHHKSSRSGDEEKKSRPKETSGTSSTAHPPPGAPTSGDPRRSDVNRQAGSSATADGGAELNRAAASSSTTTVTLKPVRNNSSSLLPQPPTLSNTESKNYRGRGATSGSGGAAGNSFNAAIASLQASDGLLPTRADSKDFLLRRDNDGKTTTAATAAAAGGAASPRRSTHESSRRHRTRRSSNASSRHDGSFSFSSESLLDGKARGRLAKAAAASNAAANSAERRRGPSSNAITADAEGEGSASKRRLPQQQQQQRDQSSTSSRASQHFRHEDVSPRHPNSSTHAKSSANADGDDERPLQRQHHHRNGGGDTRRSSDVEIFESSGSQRRRRSRSDLYGSTHRPSSASVSLVAGLDEVLPHRPMQSRKNSTSTVASSSRASSASSGERRDEAVGRNSVRCLRKMAAKARDVSASSSCDLEARASSSATNRNDTTFHAHTKAMAQMSDQNNSNHSGTGGSGHHLARKQHSSSTATANAPAVHHPSVAAGSGSGGAYAMKLPSFKPSNVAESSSSNDVSTDRPANSGGSRQQHQQQQQQLQQQQQQQPDAGAAQLQRLPLTMSHEGGAGPFRGSGNYLLLQPTRPAGTSGNGRLSYTIANNANNSSRNNDGAVAGSSGGAAGGTEKDALGGVNLKTNPHNTNISTNSGSGGDRVMSSVESRKTAANGVGGGSSGGVTLPPVSGQQSSSSASGVDSNADAVGGPSPFFGEGGVRTSVTSALLAQPRDGTAKRRRPTTENFTPWSVDLSRFDKLRQAQTSSPPAT